MKKHLSTILSLLVYASIVGQEERSSRNLDCEEIGYYQVSESFFKNKYGSNIFDSSGQSLSVDLANTLICGFKRNILNHKYEN